jgi:hypothetical protein
MLSLSPLWSSVLVVLGIACGGILLTQVVLPPNEQPQWLRWFAPPDVYPFRSIKSYEKET